MLEQAKAAWGSLQPRQRITLGIASAVMLIGLGAVGLWSSQPGYSVLYSGLAPADASAVVEELTSAKTPYRLAEKGGSIEVPSGKLYETRLALAGKGLPSSGGVGFELFDQSTLPGTDFSNNVNLQRALQGELGRTICALQSVRSARVHLALPHESLYEDPAPPTASVLLDLGPGGSLAPGQVRGIAYLVASAVDKLKPQNVTIIDSLGTILHGGGDAAGDLGETSLAAAKAFSDSMSTKLQTMLDAMFGPHKTIVRVQAELNLDTEESSEERVQPASANAKNAVVREHTSEEQYKGGGSAGGGFAGVPTSLAGATKAGATDAAGDYRNSDQTREYEFSKLTTRRQVHPGKVQRLAVAAVVDEEAAVNADRVREVLQAAAGLNLARGDTIVVRPMKLKAAELADADAKDAQAANASDARQKTIDMLLRRGMPLAVALVLLAAFVRTMNEFRRVADIPEAAALDAARGVASAGALRDPVADGARQAASPADEAQEEDELIEELRRIAREKPDALAQELRMLVSGQDGM